MNDCPGEGCLIKWIHWSRHAAGSGSVTDRTASSQIGLFTGTPYDDAAPTIRDASEFRSGVETLAYALFRLSNNRLTRAERPRLENLVENALFKMSRHLDRGGPIIDDADRVEYLDLKQRFLADRRHAEHRRNLALGIKSRMERLDKLDGDAFEDFVAEVFEAMEYDVERVGGSGDEGVDLRLVRGPLRAVVQCKYHAKGVVGSPELQKFLGTIHQSESHKGYFVTTTSFTLAAEKFAANQPMELVDGPRLAEIVKDLLTQFKQVSTESDPASMLTFGTDEDFGKHTSSR